MKASFYVIEKRFQSIRIKEGSGGRGEGGVEGKDRQESKVRTTRL